MTLLPCVLAALAIIVVLLRLDHDPIAARRDRAHRKRLARNEPRLRVVPPNRSKP